MRTPALALLAALALAAPALPALAAPPVPALTGPVVDQAGVLSAADVERLSALSRAARAVHGGQGVQLQYLIVRSLDGDPIEDFSMRVAEAWRLGTKGQDNGVLVTVALDDRRVRIEVGGGLEGGLTDAQSGRIIRGTLAPAFQAGRFGDGLYDAGVQILGALGALPSGVQPARRAAPPGAPAFSTLAVIALFVIVFLIRMVSGFGPRRRRSMWWGGGGPWIGGGGFGGGGGGGGGWSGGGGGFSGGGASGRW